MAVSVEQTIRTLLRRSTDERAARERHADEVRDRLRREMAARLPRGARAWLIGSLAWGGFGERSDVDVVVRGLPSAEATELEVALTLALRLEIDLLQAESLPPAFVERVEREGVVLHGA